MFVIYEEIGDDWVKWDKLFSTKKEAERYLLDYWADLDLDQIDYKMDNYSIGVTP